MALISCCGIKKGDQSQEVRSTIIDKQLIKDNKVYRETHRLLLLGAGESGKSTIVKQMQINYMQGFNAEARQRTIPDIYNNLRDALTSMLLARKTIVPPITFKDESHVSMASEFMDKYGMNCGCEFYVSQHFFDCCQYIWNLESIQECYARSNEYHLIDSGKYFLDRISVLRDPDYMPNDQDILRCRVLTSYIREIRFKVKEVVFHMFDVGGQRDQRRKWIQCFSDATAIVFVASLAGYNLFIREDNTTNRLQESLNLFKQVWNNRFLAEVSLILFLNKTDVLFEKIIQKRFKIEDYFPSYKAYNPAIPIKDSPSEPGEFVRAKHYLRDCFLFQTQVSDGEGRRNSRLCFPHFTCAVDTTNMRKIFEDCRLMIQRVHLDRFGILTMDT